MLLALALLGACTPARRLPEGQYLLTQNKIEVRRSEANRDDLPALMKQKPNRKLLVFRFHLGLYTMGDWFKRGWLSNWLHKIGEAPVVYDSSLAEQTRHQFEVYMFRHGYFNVSVTDTVVYKHFRRKARVTYRIAGGEPYRIRNVRFASKDELIDVFLHQDSSATLLKRGALYNEEVIDNERSRITTDLKNRGYYFFNRNFINLLVDSALGSHEVDLVVNVNRVNENVDSVNMALYRPVDHKQYYLNNIFVQTDYNPTDADTSMPTSMSEYDGMYFMRAAFRRRFKEKAIAATVPFRSGELFRQKDLDRTYSQVADLGVFKYTNIRHEEAGTDSSGRHLLNAVIQLSPRKIQGFTIETEGTHNGGNLGIAGSLSYLNRNLFRGAESFEARIYGSLESLQEFTDSLASKKLFFFNSYEVGPEIKLTKNKFLSPRFWEKYNPKTSFSASYLFQNRPDYKRNVLTGSFGYTFRNKKLYWLVFPFEISAVDVTLTQRFLDEVTSGPTSLAFLYSYNDHLITSGRASVYYTNQQPNKPRDFVFIRGFIEQAGNLLYGIYSGLNTFSNQPTDTSGNYTLFGLTYSQYIKPEVDFSYHQYLNEHSSMVYRLFGGIGFSYWNSEGKVLPFEKAYYGGGPNGIRAWKARTLGPGSFQDTSQSLNVERIGDVRMEANFEYRSVIFKYLEGAAFVDMGNMWLRKDPSGRAPGAVLTLDRLLDDMAIGAGLGARINFTFFILRFDGAVKLRDPGQVSGKEWVYGHEKFVIGDILLNFAIGYPF